MHEIRAKLVQAGRNDFHLALERRDDGIYVRDRNGTSQLTTSQHLDDALETLRWYYGDQLWLATPHQPLFVPAADFA